MIVLRTVTLSPGADELLRQLADREPAPIAPDVYASLVLELAIRERHDELSQFEAAAAKVLNVP